MDARVLTPPPLLQGVEATLFAALMSILNGGSAAGSFFGSMLTRAFGVTSTNFEALAPLLLICNLSSLAPLALLQLIPDSSASESIVDATNAERGTVRRDEGGDTNNGD